MRKLLLIAAALLLCLCGCQNAAESEWVLDIPEPNAALSAQPEVVTYPMETDETITALLPGAEGIYPLLERAQEYTGIQVEYTFAPYQSYSSTLATALSSGDMADMFYGYKGISIYTFLDYGDEIAMDLTDAVSRCAPNYLAAIREDPVMSHMAFDGTYHEMFYFYQIQQGDGLPGYGPYIRADWLEALDMDVPDTYDEYYEVLSAFRDVYGCEHAFGMQPTSAISGDYLAAGYGVTAYTSGGDLSSVGFYLEDGEVKYGPAEDGYWEYLTMLHQWHKDGLFGRDFVTWSDINAYEKMLLDGKTGLIYTNASRIAGLEHNLQNYYDEAGELIPIPDAVLHEGDVTHLGNQANNVVGGATMSVFTASEKADLCVRWCDYWYGEDGTQLVNYGTLEDIAPEQIDPANRCLLLPGIYDRKLEQTNLDEVTLAAAEAWSRNRDNTARLPADLVMSEKDQERFAILTQGLTTAVVYWSANMVLGDKSLDERAEYMEELEKCGLQKCLDCLNTYIFGTAATE